MSESIFWLGLTIVMLCLVIRAYNNIDYWFLTFDSIILYKFTYYFILILECFVLAFCIIKFIKNVMLL